jgi:DNA-binding beta-propeller fold protein YncE
MGSVPGNRYRSATDLAVATVFKMRTFPHPKALRSLGVVFAAGLLFLGGCGSGKFFIPTCQETNSCGGGTTTYGSYAYIANQTVGTLAVFPIPKTTFTTLPGSTVTLGALPSAIAATPKGTFLYVATAQGGVVMYTIGTNGALTLGNNGSAVVSALLPTYMTIDPSGNWLFIVSSSSNQLLVFQINATTGLLAQSNQSPVPLNTGSPTQIYVTPNDQNVYVGLGAGGLDGFSFNSANGALSNHIHLAPLTSGGAADNAIAADNTSTYLFVGETGSNLRVLKIASGSLTEVTGSPFKTGLGPKSIVVDPKNAYVYVASSTSNNITGYSIGTGGALTALSTSPFATGSAPAALALDSTGKYLLAICNGGTPDLQVFSFDATNPGALDSVVGVSTGSDPAGPISLAVVP